MEPEFLDQRLIYAAPALILLHWFLSLIAFYFLRRLSSVPKD